MLIPIVDDVGASWAVRASAACGALVLASVPATPPVWTGRKVFAGPFTDLGSAGEFLNAGVAMIWVNANGVNLAAFAEAYPVDRIVVRVSNEADAARLHEEGKFTRFIIPEDSKGIAACVDLAGPFLKKYPKVRLSFALEDETSQSSLVEEIAGRLHRLVKDRPIDLWAKVTAAGVEEQPSENVVSPARALLKSLAPSDRPDGLLPTVVTDERGIALGLVYSNEQSVMVSIGSGRGVYWSRSRGELWRKGESSGAIQELVSISTDCDQDALRISVIQRGTPPAFCHTGDRTCWGGDAGISHLFRTLEDRKRNAPPGSYTARLFGDMGLLSNKLLEEAQELAEAVKDSTAGTDSVKHVEEETADVLYFALTACVAGGGSLAGVEQQLDKRSLAVKRRQGDAKQSRIDEAAKRLEEIAQAKKLKEG